MKDWKISQTLTGVQQSLTELQNTISRIKQEINIEPELSKLPKSGTIIWVRDDETDNWVPRVFSRVKDSNVRCFMDGAASGDDLLWHLWTPLDTLNDIDPNIEETK